MDKKSRVVCWQCLGYGYTDEVSEELKCAPVIKNKKTVALGSGCSVCHGTGQLDADL